MASCMRRVARGDTTPCGPFTSCSARFRPSGALALFVMLKTWSHTRGLRLLSSHFLLRPATQQPQATGDSGLTARFGRMRKTRCLTTCDARTKSLAAVEAEANGRAVLQGSGASIAVIGAGAAGLAAGRILRDEGLRVTIFEKSHNVGGVWRYNPEPEARAPMYRSLVTNLPKETMAFLGFPFPENVQSFATHGQVFDYLCDYAEQHELHPLINLGCPVESIRLIPRDSPPTSRGNSVNPGNAADAANGSDQILPAAETREAHGGHDGPGAPDRWEVVYRRDIHSSSGENEGTPATGKTSNGGAGTVTAEADAGPDNNGAVALEAGAAGSAAVGSTTSTTVIETFDAVCICNGHFDKPFVPRVEGFDGFQGTSMHAYAYDTPDVEAFAGRRVLCVGSRSSGADIAREVSSVASVVHVCDRAASESVRGGERGNVWWRPTLEKFEGASGVRFKDGTSAEVDTVVWCTGYSYSFPFLEGSGLLTPPLSERVHPLYEQLFHVKHPSLTFVGLPQRIVPFPLFEVQANAVAAVMSGRASLPSLAEREQWLLDEEETGQKERGISPASRGVHALHGRQWAYLKRLLLFAGPGVVTRPPPRAPEPVMVGVDVNGDTRGDSNDSDGGDSGICSVSPGDADLGEATLPSQAPRGGKETEDKQAKELLHSLDIVQALYVDASDSWPKFPGAPDDYRLRMYRVDRESGSFSVSVADRKANGEDPSAAVAAIASLDLTDEPAGV